MYTFHPRTMSSSWYKERVCDYIYHSLEGAKGYLGPTYTNENERTAFTETIEKCQQLCQQNDLKPHEMMKALNLFKVLQHGEKRPPIYSPKRWFSNTKQVRETAIIVAMDLVSGTAKRFLP